MCKWSRSIAHGPVGPTDWCVDQKVPLHNTTEKYRSVVHVSYVFKILLHVSCVFKILLKYFSLSCVHARACVYAHVYVCVRARVRVCVCVVKYVVALDTRDKYIDEIKYIAIRQSLTVTFFNSDDFEYTCYIKENDFE